MIWLEKPSLHLGSVEPAKLERVHDLIFMKLYSFCLFYFLILMKKVQYLGRSVSLMIFHVVKN